MSEELKYLNLMRNILSNGVKRIDRTNTGTLSLFGQSFRLDVSNNFPLLTTKRVYWRGVVEELLFFISGKTDTTELEKKNVNIWKGNTSREFLDNRKLFNYKEGEYGPNYGYNWRSFGKQYIPLNERNNLEDYNDGIDQLDEAIKLIKNDPFSRRILVSAWNPKVLNEIPLPSCHYCYQFYVNEDKLSILVNMRSCDIFLGLPFNIASYSLLLYMIAHITNKKPYEVVFMLGDAHIYLNHIDQCNEQLSRDIRDLPTLSFNRIITNIDDFKYEDIKLENYNPHSSIKAEMAI